MSSSYVRTEFKNFIASDLPTETAVDLTAQFRSLQKLLNDYGVGPLDNWLGLTFIGSTESPITVGSSNTQGCYREQGALYLHIVEPARSSAGDSILARSETIRDAFRGQRIGDMIIESVTPPNFEASGTLNFDGGYSSASCIVDYYRDYNF